MWEELQGGGADPTDLFLCCCCVALPTVGAHRSTNREWGCTLCVMQHLQHQPKLPERAAVHVLSRFTVSSSSMLWHSVRRHSVLAPSMLHCCSISLWCHRRTVWEGNVFWVWGWSLQLVSLSPLQSGGSEQERTKKKRRGDRYSVQTSLIVAALKKLLPIGLNMCSPADQELINLAKIRYSLVLLDQSLCLWWNFSGGYRHSSVNCRKVLMSLGWIGYTAE